MKISAPRPLEPPVGAEIPVDNQPLTLVVENAGTNGVRPLTYVFEVATDANFANKVFVREGIEPGGDGRTTVQLPDALASDRSYYWRARALDGANTGDYSAPVNFDVFTPIVIGEPELRSPSPNSVVATIRPSFVVGNVARSGPVGAITYQIQVADSGSFGNVLLVWTQGEQGGQTTFAMPADLEHNTVYYWRVRAADPSTAGSWSTIRAFVTPPVPVIAPSPGEPVSPGAPCGPPYPSTAIGILHCQRSKFGSPLSKSQHLAFLQGSARDLNAAGISGGPFGILRKESGNNCGGYSCDIICAGQGSSQRQWDVLVDETYPAWGAPKTIANNIRVDTCVIQ